MPRTAPTNITKVNNVVVFPVERTHLRKFVEKDAWEFANGLSKKAKSGANIARAYSHVPSEIMDKEYKRISRYAEKRMRHYRRMINSDTSSAS